jgi:DNA-binding XRE family transcriptional regulator
VQLTDRHYPPRHQAKGSVSVRSWRPWGATIARPMANLKSGRQLRAARVLAGLSQKQLAQKVGVHERTARYWELKEDKAPISTQHLLWQIEAVLLNHGVIVFAEPTVGARMARVAG